MNLYSWCRPGESFPRETFTCHDTRRARSAPGGGQTECGSGSRIMPWENCECGCRDEVVRLGREVSRLTGRLASIADLASLPTGTAASELDQLDDVVDEVRGQLPIGA